MLSRFLALVAVLCLSACGANHIWATDAEIANAHYVAGPPATLTLITSINRRSGSGAHSGLLINGSERVLYDPAGSFKLADGLAPQRNDMHYGMTPAALGAYLQFQSNGIFYIVVQTVVVPQSVADQAIALASAEKPAPQGDCSHSVYSVLHQLPGFETMPNTFFPRALSRGMAKIPGVSEQTIEEFNTVASFSLLGPSPSASSSAAPATN